MKKEGIHASQREAYAQHMIEEEKRAGGDNRIAGND